MEAVDAIETVSIGAVDKTGGMASLRHCRWAKIGKEKKKTRD